MKLSLVKFTAVVALAIAAFAVPQSVLAQGNNNASGGIVVDADGVLKNRTVADPTGRLNRQRAAEAVAKLNKDVAQSSDLRKVSLRRLQAELKRLQENGEAVPSDLRHLAGLTSITHVFCYPESGDIVVAGPAEGYFEDVNGHVRGIRSGEATLLLDDLVAALRAFPADGNSANLVGCSIDPTPAGLARMQEYVARVQAQGASANQIAQGVRDSLGMQTVRVDGVAPETHMARVLVEADYRMKLMGLGLERAKGVTAYVDKIRGGSSNGITRWFFAPNYDCVRVSKDDLAMTLEGSAVQLLTESEMMDAAGNREVTQKGNVASIAFCRSFTKNFEDVALQSPVFGELANVMDLTIAAAFIREKDYYGLSGLSLDLLGDEDQFAIETQEPIKRTESVVTAVIRGGRLITPVSGGVSIHARRAVEDNVVKIDESGAAEQLRNDISVENLEPNQWWWD